MKWGRIFWRGGGFFVANLAPGRFLFTKAAAFAGGEAILWHRLMLYAHPV